MDQLKQLLQTNELLLRPLRLGKHDFPGIWRAMMPRELLSLRFPEEQHASCMSCPKICSDNFRPDYRCCTYHPRVANFLLGLAAETPIGERAVDALLNRGMLLPEGMEPAPKQWIDFLDDQHQGNYGRSVKVLCPLLDSASGFCNIYAFRNSVCSTFFCYHDHGEAGENFWAQLQTLGSQIELVLAQWALQQIGFDLAAYYKAYEKLAVEIRHVSSHEGWQKPALAELWGPWIGREKALLRTCAAVIVAHRDDLWAIANSQPIKESLTFETAINEILPPHLKDEIDSETLILEEEGGDISPLTTWQSCLAAYADLWN